MKGQKSKYKFNLIDVIVILVVLAVLAGVYYFVSGTGGLFSKSSSKNEQTMRYVIELKTVDKDYIDNLENSINKDVIETVRNGVIGKLVDIEVTPAWTLTTDADTGEMKKSEYPQINLPEVPVDEALGEDTADEVTEGDEEIEETVTDTPAEVEKEYDFYNVKLTVEAEMQYTGSSYAVGGYDVVVGTPVYFRLPYFVGTGYCVFLESVE